MSEVRPSFAEKMLSALARSIFRNRALYFYPQLFLLLLAAFYTWNFLGIDTSRDNLVGSDKSYHKIFLDFHKEFPAQDDIVAIVESESLEKNRQFVERLGSKLELETNLFTDVFYKGDLKMMGHKALLFVPEDSLKELQQTLNDYKPFIKQFTFATNLTSLFELVNKQFGTASREANEANESMIKALPALERIIKQGTEAMRHPGNAPSPGLTALFGSGEDVEKEMYITFANGRLYLVTCRALTDKLNEDAVLRMRQLVRETQFEITGINVGITGEPVLEFDEMGQSQHDSTIASIVSLVICALIFIFGYKETGRPLKATLCLIVGLGYTMAFTTAAIGHLNLLTITFVPILIGLAIDFGVHLISRYEEELRIGKTEVEAMEKALVYTGQGIFTGALTTAGAFLAMGITDFKGIQEMGIICGGGMLLCLIPMMTMLPAMLLKGNQNSLDHQKGPDPVKRASIERLWLDRPRTVMLVTICISVVCGLQFRKVYFDYNLLNMQSKGLPAVVFEQKLVNSGSKSVLFAAVIATNLDQAQDLTARLKQLPSVGSVESMSLYLAENQTNKLQLVRQIKEGVASVHFASLDKSPINLLDLSRTLWALQGYLGLAIDETVKSEPKLSQQLASLKETIGEFRKQALLPQSEIPARLEQFQNALFSDIHQTFTTLAEQDSSAPLSISDLPPALRNRFIGVHNHYLLQVYPKKDIWQRDNQAEFIKELRTVDSNVTGTPVQLLEYTGLLVKSYLQAAKYALIAIALMVLIHFRSFVCVLLALLPVLIGTIWMLGLMGLADIPFNPANIMTLPLVIGIGVTNGIHILNRYKEEQNPEMLAKSTGKAVLVSGLTTVAGFGSLMLAKHQGIASLGFVMSVGIATCLIASLTFLPALLILLGKKGWKLGQKRDAQ
ncbi:MAG: putative exporter of the superfamily [Verrucomicrobiales bacterium]|nr:putative exporter of the superfamily [Verrucomicrobiales bacterium]